MFNLKPVTLCDKPWMDEIFALEQSRSADFNFGNIYIWDKHYSKLVGRYENRVIIKFRYRERGVFAFPVGSGPLSGIIELLHSAADAERAPLTLIGITEENLALLEDEFPGRFEFSENEDNADYIYLVQRLSTYSGKALHSKKNHCNRFEAENDWSFVPLTREMIPACLDMLDIWSEDNAHRLHSSIEYEHDAIIRAFAAYDRLSLEGGVLLSGGKVLGFSIGEMTCRDTFDVHFEKAERSISGAYPMVCREMCRMLSRKHPDLIYVNREEDMGLDSLRRSKLSYKPEFMLRKFTGIEK